MNDVSSLDGKSFALTGPMPISDPVHTPVRGDLAHINLAGRYLVPHYAVPLPRKVGGKVWLRSAANLDSEELCELAEGRMFDVLDIAGDWAWGQYGEGGCVGYVPLGNLIAP